jgi:mannose-6-phosphate isomerase-like protein (cupin superfamily)
MDLVFTYQREQQMYHVDNAVMPTHLWEGMTIRDLTPEGVTWGASFIEIDVPAGCVHPLARSSSCESFYYCERGQFEFVVANNSFHMGTGDLIEVKANEWYGYSNKTSEPARLLNFDVPPYVASAVEYQKSE